MPHFLHTNHCLSSRQFGFLPQQSAKLALNSIVSKINDLYDRNNFGSVISLSLSLFPTIQLRLDPELRPKFVLTQSILNHEKFGGYLYRFGMHNSDCSFCSSLTQFSLNLLLQFSAFHLEWFRFANDANLDPILMLMCLLCCKVDRCLYFLVYIDCIYSKLVVK